MRETLFLIGEIFIIICMQTVFDFFVDDKRNPYLATALKTACYVGAFYLVLKFVFDNIMKEIFTVFNMTF